MDLIPTIFQACAALAAIGFTMMIASIGLIFAYAAWRIFRDN